MKQLEINVKDALRVDAPRRRWAIVQLALSTVSLGCIWGMLLPAHGKNASYQARQELFESRSIDPSAMFYTELDCLERALANTDRLLKDRAITGGKQP